jgi:prolyl-tRNA synthetase
VTHPFRKRCQIGVLINYLVEQVKEMLDNIQQCLFDAAKQKRDACIQTVKTWDEFVEALSQRKMILAPWCDEEL